MRLKSLVAGVVLAMAAALPGLAFDTPRALIEAVYAPYLADQSPDDEAGWRSTGLNALYKADEERTPEGEMGALDFDPYVDGQDFQITDLAIDEPVLDGDKGTVTVRFRNFDQPREMVYSVVREADGWKVDDLKSVLGEYPYTLSEILAGQ